jgi:Putative DNA-binding domain
LGCLGQEELAGQASAHIQEWPNHGILRNRPWASLARNDRLCSWAVAADAAHSAGPLMPKPLGSRLTAILAVSKFFQTRANAVDGQREVTVESYLERVISIWGSDPNDPSAALDWIENTIARKAEEGLYLDFKSKSDKRDPALNDDDKANLAKAISGFANTDGGLIVWGVKANANKKEEPDVARELLPINNLKTFQTMLNSLSGEVVNPPVAGVESRLIPNAPGSDMGYVITIVPKRRDTVVQANAKTCKGFYVRSGSGFYQLPASLIAEFYRRRPSPILRLSLQLVEPAQVEFVEELIKAENWRKMATFKCEPWGQCTYRQNLAVKWCANLKNEGLGSANQIVVNLKVSTSAQWSVISFKVDKNFHRGSSWSSTPIYAPVPTTCFKAVTSKEGVGKALEPIHPGDQIEVAFGVLHIPFEAFRGAIDAFEISGFAYAADSPPFPLSCRVEGSEIRACYLQVFQALCDQVPQAIRIIPKPHDRAIRLDE